MKRGRGRERETEEPAGGGLTEVGAGPKRRVFRSRTTLAEGKNAGEQEGEVENLPPEDRREGRHQDQALHEGEVRQQQGAPRFLHPPPTPGFSFIATRVRSTHGDRCEACADACARVIETGGGGKGAAQRVIEWDCSMLQ